ncbi:hypothetical protein Ahy_B10g100491 isoform C [Arachis hypogaea]|uniref:Ubiquitin-like domain-containing protein n=1 Tax=Arachis hypogaea TaxID=3818 RepID=A0A444WWY2_ARAHY|nr:hypothetical protein Ahy_B10g100491 isoform C [Arachis hypogaea]
MKKKNFNVNNIGIGDDDGKEDNDDEKVWLHNKNNRGRSDNNEDEEEKMIEVVLNDRLGKKVRVKCNDDDTIGDLKKLVAAQTGTRADKIRIQKLRDPRRHGPRTLLQLKSLFKGAINGNIVCNWINASNVTFDSQKTPLIGIIICLVIS